ncbi:MAG TPA: hypothetical protein PKM21_04925 [Anaerolineales bacterium]|nr:hypothetical protein [Anaerolineales bacterium]
MKRIFTILLTALTIFALSFPFPNHTAQAYGGYPYFSIESVNPGKSVTIRAHNFPANDTFMVTMGYYGGYGIGGVVVGVTTTGSGGTFVATYDIPGTLAGQSLIAIRLQSSTSGYYAYNWFSNSTGSSGSPAPAPGYSGYPYFFITSVNKDDTVTIKAYNFPANDTFNVTMGTYGSYGIGGVVVGSSNTGAGGTFVATYDIPASLEGAYQIAIRLQSPTTGYFAYNWFYNNTTAAPVNPPAPGPGNGYSGYPYFFITAVARNNSVTINAFNFPKNDTFTVTMGAYGTYGISGTVVGSTNTGNNGNFSATYEIPDGLAGSYQIAIRLQSPTTGYFAYNWFYNNSTP